jgi:GxxExxY protein
MVFRTHDRLTQFTANDAGVRFAHRAVVSLVADPPVEQVLGCAIDIHRSIGPGLLESAYEACLAYELTLRQIRFERQFPVPLVYKGVQLNCSYRVDLFIENRLIVEVKTVDRLLPIYQAQVLTYLRLLNLKQGLILNFHTQKLTDGIKSLLL